MALGQLCCPPFTYIHTLKSVTPHLQINEAGKFAAQHLGLRIVEGERMAGGLGWNLGTRDYHHPSTIVLEVCRLVGILELSNC